MDEAGIFCKFCLEGIIDKQFQILGEVKCEVLSVLVINVGLGKTDDYMCNDCSVKLFAAYDFKIMCLETESSLVPYIDFANASHIDLRRVYLNRKVKDNLTVTLDQQVCRLCVNIVDDEFLSLKEVCDVNMDSYIPEVNFSITKDPVFCKHCYNSLITHINFLKRLTNVDKKIKKEAQDLDDNLFVKNEDVDDSVLEETPENALFINSDGDEEDNKGNIEILLHELNESVLKDEIVQEHCVIKDEIENMDTSCSSNSQGVQENCSEYNLSETISDNETNCKSDLVIPDRIDICCFKAKIKHLLKHKDSSEVRTYKCDECDYQTKIKRYLTQHQLRHKDPSEVQMYKCDKCNYQAKKKYRLIRHQLRHRNPSEVQMYKCGECDYHTKIKRYLTQHQLRHKDPSEVQMYKCDECDYQTKYKRILIRHQLRHRDPSEVQMYKCDECDYQTKHRASLISHNLGHKDPSEIQMYKCDECDYQGKHKNSLTRHQLRHKDPSEVQMYKCNQCDFQTRHKRYITGHQLRHRDPSEVQMYKCDECDYQSKRKGTFSSHQLRHKDPSEMLTLRQNRKTVSGNTK